MSDTNNGAIATGGTLLESNRTSSAFRCVLSGSDRTEPIKYAQRCVTPHLPSNSGHNQ